MRHITPRMKQLAKKIDLTIEQEIRELAKQGYGVPVSQRRNTGRGGY